MESIFDIEGKQKLQKHFKIKDVAEICAVSDKTVRRWIKKKEIKAHSIGGSIRIPLTELLKFIKPIE